MKTINQRYNAFKDKNIGAVITLKRSVRGMKYGKQLITNAFNKFVPKDEYAKDEKDEILQDLWSCSFNEEVAKIPLINKDLQNA